MKKKEDKLKLIQQLLASAKNSIHSAEQIIKSLPGAKTSSNTINKKTAKLSSSADGKIIKGVFNGIKMIGPENKEYTVPENYASKSKLVEGDVLKLTIAEDGSFIFKQIGPVARKKIIGKLVKNDDGFRVVAEGKSYKVLQAPVMFYKAQDGDDVSLVVPEGKDSEWAALENVIKKSGDTGDVETETELDDVNEEEVEKTAESESEPKEAIASDQDDLARKISNESDIEFEKSDEMLDNGSDNVGSGGDTTESIPNSEAETSKADEKPGEGVKELEI